MVNAVPDLRTLCPQDPLALLRRHAALVRSLLDELDRTLPQWKVTDAFEAAGVREQLVEELGRMGCRLLECAASLTEVVLERQQAGQA